MKCDRVKITNISVMLSSISNAEVISSSSKREVKRSRSTDYHCIRNLYIFLPILLFYYLLFFTYWILSVMLYQYRFFI